MRTMPKLTAIEPGALGTQGRRATALREHPIAYAAGRGQGDLWLQALSFCTEIIGVIASHDVKMRRHTGLDLASAW